MKCLKINSGKGQFSTDGAQYSDIDIINKDDVLALLDLALDENSDFEMDPYDEEMFTNPAHRIIYKNLHDKFVSLNVNKDHFNSEVTSLYQDTLDKYKQSEEEPR